MTPVQEQICALISAGMLLSEITALDGMPARETVYRWLRDDPRFAAEFELARMQAADGLDEEIHRLATSATRENANAVRVQVETLKWRAGRMHPAKYGVAPGALVEAAAAAPEVDVAALRTSLIEKIDAVAERIESHDRERFFVSRLVDAALRELEGQRRLDPMDEADRALIFATVQRAITPNFVAVPEAGLAAGELETVSDLQIDEGAVPFAAEAAE
jgi:hypothetical protein